ncbi:MAG TPA: VCBS domain-containing protein, partial [Burkholderiales bacterium]
WETTDHGNRIQIVDGKIQVDISHAISALGATDLNSLSATDHIHDSFTYAIQLGNGTLSVATVTIDVQGQNDMASFAPGGDSGAAYEDGANASGVLHVNDADHGEAHTQATNGSGANGLGSYTVDSDGNWNYSADHVANDHLAAGATATDSFVVDSQDGTAHQTVNVTIVGTNDAASFQSGGDSGNAMEDGASATGQVTVNDVDDGEAHTQADSGSGANGLGSYSVDTDGNWSYSADHGANDHLAAGATATDSFEVTSQDGTAHHTVNVTIVGTNDQASIGGALAGDVSEDGTAAAGGTVAVSDVDDGQAAAVATSSLHGTYGDFTFDSQSGDWTYALRNDDANVQALNSGDTVTDSLQIASLDGTDSDTIVVSIHGADDAPAQIPAVLPTPYAGGGDPNDFDNLGLPGTQVLIGGNQSQTLYGGPATDFLTGSNSGNGGDALYGGSGGDVLSGQNGADALYGGSGGDSLNGGSGPDTLIGGYGADSITGGSAPDTIRYLDLLDTGDTITDFVSGTDKIDLSAIDANSNASGNQAFGWGGQQAGPYAVANSVTWTTDGTNTTVIADTDGNVATAEFSITLAGVTNLLVTDFNTL